MNTLWNPILGARQQTLGALNASMKPSLATPHTAGTSPTTSIPMLQGVKIHISTDLSLNKKLPNSSKSLPLKNHGTFKK